MRFVNFFVEISRPISKMLKKGSKFRRGDELSVAFQKIKHAIKDVLVLRAPNYFYANGNIPFCKYYFKRMKMDMKSQWHLSVNPYRL